MIVFGKEWFIQHQSKLLHLANSPVGRYIFGMGKRRGVVVEVTPTGYVELIGVDPIKRVGILKGRYFSYDRMAKCLYKNLKFLWKGMHTIDSILLDHQKLIPDFGFSSYYEFEGETGGGQSFDQDGYTSGASSGWASVKAKTVFDTVHSASDITSYVGVGANYFEDYTLYRAVSMMYTASQISSGSTMMSAVFGAKVFSVTNPTTFWTAPNHGVVLVECDIASPESSLVVGDWDAFILGTAISSEVLSGSVSIGNYNEWTFNSSGLSIISTSGTTQMGLVMIGDRENITPSYTPDPEPTLSQWAFYTNDASSHAYPNYLDVTWYVIESNTFLLNIGDVFKNVTNVKINVGDSWKQVIAAKINVGDVWKDIF